jgi:amino acid transporter
MSSLAVSVIARLITYTLVSASLIKLRKTQPEGTHFKIPYGNYFAILGIVATLWLLSGSQSKEILDTILWTSLGFVIYALHKIGKGKYS